MERQPDSFDDLLMRLEPECADPQQAYRRCRDKLIKFFQWRSCEDSDALADDAIARLAQKISEGVEIQSEKPYQYVYAIALNVYREYLRGKRRQERIRLEWIPPTPVRDEQLACKRQCLERLARDKRELLERYYGSNEEPSKIAEELGVNLGALRLRVHRIKTELHPCYKKCREE